MKKFMKKAMAVLMAVLFVSGVYAPVANAATNNVILHVQDGQAWGSLNVYNWGDNGETAGVWPGAVMTEEADGWFTYTFETEVPLNLVFSAEGGAPQSGNVDGVAADAGEIWIVIGGSGDANDLGAATNAAVLYTEPQEGWPTAAVAEVAAETTETTETATVDVPKTGESTTPAVIFITLAVFAGAAAVVMKKKEHINEK